MFYISSGVASGCVVNLVEEPETFVHDQQEVAPTVAFAVPRVWEKQHSTVVIKLKDGTALGRLAYDLALKAGLKRAQYRKAGKPVPWHLALVCAAFDFLVFKNIRVYLGIDRCRWLSTGAAPIAPELIDWFWALNVPMYEIYGQTECSGIATANLPGQSRIGSVGKSNREVDVALSEQNEILIRSAGGDRRLLEQAGEDGGYDTQRLVAYRRRGPYRRRRLRLHRRPDEGHHHHRGVARTSRRARSRTNSSSRPSSPTPWSWATGAPT